MLTTPTSESQVGLVGLPVLGLVNMDMDMDVDVNILNGLYADIVMDPSDLCRPLSDLSS